MNLLFKIVAIIAFAMAGFSLWQQNNLRSIILDVIKSEPEALSEVTIQGFERIRRKSIEEGKVAQQKKIIEKKSDLESSVDTPFVGQKDAPIVIVEFMDFRCGYCRSAAENLTEFLKKNPDVRVNIKFLPILGDESAKIAVYALLANQKGKFNEFYKKMMQSVFPDEIAALSILESLNIKTKTKLAAKQKEQVMQSIVADSQLAQELDISATPSFVVGDEVVVGAQISELEEAVNKLRSQKQQQNNDNIKDNTNND